MIKRKSFKLGNPLKRLIQLNTYLFTTFLACYLTLTLINVLFPRLILMNLDFLLLLTLISGVFLVSGFDAP